MWPDQVSNPGPLTYESGVLLTATQPGRLESEYKHSCLEREYKHPIMSPVVLTPRMSTMGSHCRSDMLLY